MPLSIFNPTTLENRLGTEEELAALYAREPAESPAPEADNSPGPRPQKEKDESPASDSQNGRPSIVLGEDEVLIDWETHLYDFATQQIVPIHIPLSQQLEEFKQLLLGEVATLRERIDTLAVHPRQFEGEGTLRRHHPAVTPQCQSPGECQTLRPPLLTEVLPSR